MSDPGHESQEPSVADGSPSRGRVSGIALAVAVLAVPLAIVGALVFAVIPGSFLIGVIGGLLIAVALVLLRVRNADAVVLSGLDGGVPIAADADVARSAGVERLTNLVQSLSLAAGVAEPQVLVVPDSARNALVASSGGRNHLLMTTGLLDHIDVIEMEGVVAELLVRLRSGDAENATIGAALFGRPMIDGPLGAVLGPVGRAGLGMLLEDDRDLSADRNAVALTRYPPGLLAALQRMNSGDPAPSSASPGSAHMWLVDPIEGSSPRSDLDLRIDILAEY